VFHFSNSKKAPKKQRGTILFIQNKENAMSLEKKKLNLPDTSELNFSSELGTDIEIQGIRNELPKKSINELDFTENSTKENKALQLKIIERNKLLVNALSAEVEVHELRANEVKHIEEIEQLRLCAAELQSTLEIEKINLKSAHQFEIQSVLKENSQLKEQLQIFTANNTSLGRELIGTQNLIKDKEEKINQQVLLIENLNAQLENEIQTNKTNYEEQKNQYLKLIDEINQNADLRFDEIKLQNNLINEELKLNQQTINQAQEQNKTLTDQLKTLTEQSIDAENKKNRFKDGMLELNVLNSKLNEDILKYTNQIQQLSELNKNTEAKVENLKLEINKRIKVSQQIYREKQELILNIDTKMRKGVEAKAQFQRELENKDKKIQDEVYARSVLEKTNCELLEKIMGFDQGLKNTASEKINLQTSIENYEKQINNLTSEIIKVNMQIEKETIRNQEQQEKNSLHIQKESEIREQLNLVKDKLNENNLTYQAQISELKNQIQLVSSAFDSEKDENASLIEKLKSIEQKLAQKETQIQVLNNNISISSDQSERTLEEQEQKLMALQTIHQQTVVQKDSSLKLVEEYQSQIQLLEVEFQNVLHQNTLNQKNFEDEKMQIEKWIGRLNNRELQFRDYVQHLEGKRNELLARMQQFISEMAISTKLHPLKDLLKFTDHQLEQLEFQFKKLPLLASDRPDLEVRHEQLSEQRGFLKAIIEQTREQVEKQIQELKTLMKIDPPVALPPMPTMLKKNC
jgi:chromosome segregation ATPase